ncbi:MAG TPA: nucleoside triphosphate pyrophosphatase [Gammaproteobacteria bacterium]|nr:nucleoside triphosphate pyrophosphatase [Gammaproteobacteria bacterium]
MTGVQTERPQLYLASSSPRRRQLLAQLGVRYHVLTAGIDERRRDGEAPRDYARRMAISKARRAAADPSRDAALPVLAADTVVTVDGTVLGKPVHRDDALSALARLSGRSHEVITAVALLHDIEAVRLSVTRVTFRVVHPGEAEAYWETGEPGDKAGAYAVQGLGAVFVSRLEGSYTGVVGLPLFETAQLLGECGVSVLAPRGIAETGGDDASDHDSNCV